MGPAIMDPFAWLWIGWIGMFVVVEGVAIARKERGDTLSEKVWSVIFTDKALRKPRGPLLYLLGGGMVWLFAHFMFGGRLG